jgi:hypothetical protein
MIKLCSTQIHHGNNKSLVGTNLVNKSERKAMSAATSCSRRQRVPCMRVGENSCHRSINFIQEDCSQPVLLLLVMHRRQRQLSKRRCRKSIVRHFLRDERRSCRAAGPLTADNSPRSTASIRSSDSEAHFASISLMRDSSRLSHSRSINLARSWESS